MKGAAVDYNKLSTFIKVAELGSITKAAHLLRRSQPAITQQVQLLEEELGLKLLERRKGKISLSVHGQEIYARTKSSLSSIKEEITKLKDDLTRISGHIRVGVLNDGSNEIDYGTLFGKFTQKYPEVRLTIVEGTSASLEKSLIENLIDFSFQINFDEPESFIRKALHKSTHDLYTSKKYLEQRGPIKDFESLLELDLIDLSDQFLCLGTYIQKHAPKLKPRLMHRLPSIATTNLSIMQKIVESGFGVAILPEHLVAKKLASGTIVKIFPKLAPLHTEIDIAYRTHKTLTLSEKMFLEYISKTKQRKS